jgi:DNA-binding GntR family transcriptional regulator
LRSLEKASEAMDVALHRDDLDAWGKADERFHATSVRQPHAEDGHAELLGSRTLRHAWWRCACP